VTRKEKKVFRKRILDSTRQLFVQKVTSNISACLQGRKTVKERTLLHPAGTSASNTIPAVWAHMRKGREKKKEGRKEGRKELGELICKKKESLYGLVSVLEKQNYRLLFELLKHSTFAH